MIPPQQSIRVRIGLLPVLLVFLVLVIFTSSLGLAAQPIKVGVYENAPKIFTRDGQPAGILVDIIEEIGRREGWQISYVSGSWADNLDRLARGEIDLMPDMAYSAERSTVFDYPKVPALSSWFQIYAPKGHGSTPSSILTVNASWCWTVPSSSKPLNGCAKGLNSAVLSWASPITRPCLPR